MGDFAGGLLKYLRARPIPRVTIAGGPGKMSKLADGKLLGTRVVFFPPSGAVVPWFGGARAVAFRPDGREFAVACGAAVAVFPAGALPPD